MEAPRITNSWSSIEPDLNPKRSADLDLSKPFYRFISEEALDFLLNGSFILKNPATWWDPYEKIIVNGDFTAISYNKPAAYVACFTQANNSEAHWKMYTYGHGNCFRVEFDLINLIGSFCLAEPFSPGPMLYFGKVSYGLTENSLKAIGKNTCKYHEIAFPKNFSNDNYVDLLLLKRRAFKWEEESRLVLLSEYNQEESMKLCYDPSVLPTFVKSIKVGPSCDDAEYERLKIKYSRIINDITTMHHYNNQNIAFSRSQLYKPVSPIVVEA